MALGRATKGGPIKAFSDCMQMRTGKREQVRQLVLFLCLAHWLWQWSYTVVVGWIFKYTYLAFFWKASAMGNDMSAIGWYVCKLQQAHLSNNMWLIIPRWFVTAVIMALGIAGGIEKANKGP